MVNAAEMVSSAMGSSILQQAVLLPHLSAADALCTPAFAACLNSVHEQQRRTRMQEGNARAVRVRSRTQCSAASTASSASSSAAAADDSGGGSESCEDILAQICAVKGNAAQNGTALPSAAELNTTMPGSLPEQPGQGQALPPGLKQTAGFSLTVDEGADPALDLLSLRLIASMDITSAASGDRTLPQLQAQQNNITPYLLYCFMVLNKYRRPERRRAKGRAGQQQTESDHIRKSAGSLISAGFSLVRALKRRKLIGSFCHNCALCLNLRSTPV